MGGEEDLSDMRRSSRIPLSIPVEVSGRGVDGQEIYEKTTTDLVNKHGGRISLQHRFSVGSEIVVSIPRMGRQQRCRIAWVSDTPSDGGGFQTGVELERAENFWGIHFPPEDWNAPEPAPLRVESQVPHQPQSEMGEYELRRLSSILGALVSVLEEKGVLSRAELADRLKRSA